MSRWPAPVLAAAVLAVAGCQGGHGAGSRGAAPPAPNPGRSELVAAADLDPCPPSPAPATPATHGLPDVTLPCLGAGPAVDLAALRGKPLVLNIWGSWCGPCQKETPYFAQLYDELKGQVRFLGVDTEDDPDSALDFAPHVSPPMRYPSVVDDDKSVLLGLHGPVAVPSTVFVAADGTVVEQVPKAYDGVAQLRGDIARYLGVGR